MSVRSGLLALLEHGPRYGYQLRAEFEEATGATWPLNVGQVYTTLARLERDGLVRADGDDGDGHQYYAITDAGRLEVRSWFATPVRRESRPRDELAIKLAVATRVAGVAVVDVIQAQRTDTMRALQDYTRLKARAGDDDLAWLLILDGMVFQAEAEIRWLDHCESRLVRARAPRAAATSETPARSPRSARTVERR